MDGQLLRPDEDFIEAADTETIVVVPEGALRTIPISTLHDGERFLVERFAVATTPGIQLTKTLQVAESNKLLVGGLTESVQGFAELPNVEREINTINAIYPSETSTTMQNSTFQLERVEAELSDGGYIFKVNVF